MKTLQFVAEASKHRVMGHPLNECYITQEYVAALLSKQLENYGFDTQYMHHEYDKIEVCVNHHHLPISILCYQQSCDGKILCEITTNSQTEQAWFEKIETQSVIRQLAQAVEQSLKTEQHFSQFIWKN